jgi:hypothetical protein
MQTAAQAGMTPIFYTAQVEDVLASREAGRPIFIDEERIEYRFASNRNFNFHDLAHGFHEEKNGEVITHAMRFPDAYKKFKETGGNEASGTPLQNLPGLTAIQLSTLKALSVYTIESLASLEGQGIKNLGPQGHALKQSAQKYLAAAGGRVGMTEVLEQIAALQKRNEELTRMVEAGRPGPITYVEPEAPAFVAEVDDVPQSPVNPYYEMEEAELKDKIEALAGSRPRGNPNKATLVGMLTDLEASQ